MDDEKKLWDRLPNETARAYKAFTIYRDLRRERSLAKVSEKIGYSSRGSLSLWSKKYRWQERAIAFDEYEDKLQRQKQIEEIVQMNNRHIQQLETLQQIVLLPAYALLEKFTKNEKGNIQIIEELKRLSNRELFNLIIQLSKVFTTLMASERLARGVPTEITKNENTTVINEIQTIFGDVIANNEEATRLFYRLVETMANNSNGKPGHNGNGNNKGTLSNTGTYQLFE